MVIRKSKREQQILGILTTYPQLSTGKIIELLYPGESIKSSSSKYSSVLRTLKFMEKRGLLIKEYIGTLWKKVEEPK